MYPHPLIVVNDGLLVRTIRNFIVFHSHLPELRGEGSSPEAAITCLADRLAFAIAENPDNFHREPLRKALADAQASLMGPLVRPEK